MIGHLFGYGRRSEHAAPGYSYFASQKRESASAAANRKAPSRLAWCFSIEKNYEKDIFRGLQLGFERKRGHRF